MELNLFMSQPNSPEVHLDLDRPCSLVECARILQVVLGDAAPAHITLKRWSSGGRLAHAKVETPGGKPRFIPRRVLEEVKGSSPDLPSAEARPLDGGAAMMVASAAPMPALAPSAELDELRASISKVEANQSSIAETLGTLSQQIRDIHAELSNLDATRKMLMNNSDALTTTLRQRLMQAEGQLRSQKTADLDYIKLMRVLGQVESLLLSR